MIYNFVGYTSQPEPFPRIHSMGSHDDQVKTIFFRNFEYFFGDVVCFFSSQDHRNLSSFEIFLCPLEDFFGRFVSVVEFFLYIDNCYLRLVFFVKLVRILKGLHGMLGLVNRNKYLIHKIHPFPFSLILIPQRFLFYQLPPPPPPAPPPENPPPPEKPLPEDFVEIMLAEAVLRFLFIAPINTIVLKLPPG